MRAKPLSVILSAIRQHLLKCFIYYKCPINISTERMITKIMDNEVKQLCQRYIVQMTSLVRNPGHILVLSSLRFLQIDRLNSTRRRSSFLLDVVSALKIYFLHLQLISQMRNMLPGECVLSAKPVTEHWACEDTLSEFNLDSIFQRKRK